MFKNSVKMYISVLLVIAMLFGLSLADSTISRTIDDTITLGDRTYTEQEIMQVQEDLSKLSDNDLVLLARQINKEISYRKIALSANLATGTYKIGDEIPAGKYDICLDPDTYAWGGEYAITTQPTLTESREEVITLGDLKSSATYITLNEGEYLMISTPAILTMRVDKVIFK